MVHENLYFIALSIMYKNCVTCIEAHVMRGWKSLHSDSRVLHQPWDKSLKVSYYNLVNIHPHVYICTDAHNEHSESSTSIQLHTPIKAITNHYNISGGYLLHRMF